MLRRRTAATCFRDRSGVSAIEFALILPLILAILCGMTEMAHAVDGWRKLTRLARTVADLTSQGDSTDPMASGTMNDILASSTTILRPFASTGVKIVVSALGVDTGASLLNPRVCSSVANSNATARATGIASDLTIPLGFNTNGNRYVLAEVTMPYSPMIGTSLVKFVGGINGAITLRSSFPWPVRNGTVHNSTSSTPEVTLPSGSACP